MRMFRIPKKSSLNQQSIRIFYRISMKCITIFIALLAFNFNSFSAKWQNIFDGKSFTGWTEKTKEGTFEIKDGAIVGTMILDKGTTFLCYEKEYSDLELEFEVKILHSELNSGVQFRSRCKEPSGKQKYGAVYGPQVELTTKSDKTRSGFIFGQGWKGWLTPKESESNSFMKKGEWNKVRVKDLSKGDE